MVPTRWAVAVTPKNAGSTADAQKQAFARLEALQRAQQARDAAERAAAAKKRDPGKDAAVQAAKEAVQAAKKDLYVSLQNDKQMPSVVKEKLLGVTSKNLEDASHAGDAWGNNASSEAVT